MNPEAVRLLNVLAEIEGIVRKLRVQVAASVEPLDGPRFDEALERLRGLTPRVEALAGSGAA